MRRIARNAGTILMAVVAAGLLAACSSSGSGDPVVLHDVLPQAVPLLRFGVERDGSLSRAKVIAVLKREFAAADTNRDGVLERDEVNVVNEQRWKNDREATSLLTDWNSWSAGSIWPVKRSGL